jgi:putative SOS response-associated peptidase YedK
MCFNASLVQTAEIIEDLFGAEFPEERFDFPAFFMSAFEHPSWPILKQGDTESFVPALWGLVPSWINPSQTPKAYGTRLSMPALKHCRPSLHSEDL